MLKNLTPRSIAALAVVAASFFLAGCVLTYGGSVFANVGAAAHAPAAARLSGWLVQNLGAGLWALLFLPMIWAAIVYFEERTPDLVLRLVGTVLLAVSISTIAGLVHSGLWAGHVGNAVAGTLAGDGGALRVAFAWLVTLCAAFVSTMFATDWIFHSLRRAGRAATETQSAPVVAQPAATEFTTPARAAPVAAQTGEREFVVETPRAAVAAAEMDDVLAPSDDVFATPIGWDETETEGRTVIAAPSGYRGVEFLPPSDELLIPTPMVDPRVSAPVVASEASAFHDEEFVTTSDAAFFRETPGADVDEVEEPVAMAEEVDEDAVSEAVETLFAAVTEPAPAPVGGIGLPEDSAFRDEFFAADAGWPYAESPASAASDGASAADEMATTYAAERTPAPAPEPAPVEEVSAFEDEEIVVSRIPDAAFDDAFPGEPEPVSEARPEPVAETVAEPEVPANRIAATFAHVEAASAEAVLAATAEQIVVSEPVSLDTVETIGTETVVPAEPAPQLTLFSDPVAPVAADPAPASAVATLPEVNLALLHTMELDPLFRDAVAAVLERGRASAVVLQRQLGIGYARGIRILDQMTTAGLTGPDTPTGMRELRVSREAWAAFTA